jgi:enoyl-CoA hydratase/carnithine racemase
MSLLGRVPGARPDRAVRRRLCELAEFPKPLIAAINGAAAGMGFALAISCDLRFCAETSFLTTSFAKVGLIAEHGVAWILPRLVGLAHALDLLLSGRTVGGAEAEAMGLVNRSLPQGDAPPISSPPRPLELGDHQAPAPRRRPADTARRRPHGLRFDLSRPSRRRAGVS